VYAIESIHPVPAAWLRASDLAPFVPAYARRLVERRYAANTVRMYVYGVAHFARWMRRCRVDVRDLADEVVQRFIDEHLPRCSCPSPVQRCRHQVRAALRQLLITLVDAGVLVSSRQPDAIEDQLAHFDAHMRQAMGLAETTRVRRLSVVRSLLQFRLTGDAGSDATTLPSSDELRRFIAQELSRVSPASASSLAGALRGYLCARQRFVARAAGMPVFATPAGGALSLSGVHHVFARLRDQLGWRARGEHARPRIHDLRHTMVVRRVQRWNEDGASIDHAMFWLCTYLGHANISDTYWYLTGTPELMESVGVRFERFVLQGSNHE
jgi:site-specific recombinase XerD